MKRIKVMLFILAIMLLVSIGCADNSSTTGADKVVVSEDRVASTKPIVIGVSQPPATHGYNAGVIWWTKKAMDDWEKKDPNVKFLYRSADTVAKQAADIEDLLVQGIDGLVVYPVDITLTPVVVKAYEQGVYVVVVDRGISVQAYDVWISNDDEAYGRNALEWVAKDLGYEGDIVMIEGIPSNVNDIRMKAARDVVAKYPNLRIVDSQPGNWNKEKALSVMENYLQKYDTIDAVVTLDDDMLEGVLQAYKESGRSDIKTFFGGAGSKTMVKRIIDGDELVRANATYPPDCHATSVSLAVLGLRGTRLEGFYQKKLPIRIILNSELITKENAKDYYYPDSVF